MSASPAAGGLAAPAGGKPAPLRTRLSWTVLVAASVAVLLLAALALGIGWAASSQTRIGTYVVRGTPERIELDLRAGSAEILGGGSGSVLVRRTDRFAFGHDADERRSAEAGVFRVSSRCPSLVVGQCAANYRLTVPDNVPVVVRTADGAVRLSAFRGSARIETRGGDVNVDAFCGFGLSVKTVSGGARATASCSPQRLDLRSTSGSLDATVPSASYRVEADSDGGRRQVTGLEMADEAPFEIRALSGSGDVTLRGGG